MVEEAVAEEAVAEEAVADGVVVDGVSRSCLFAKSSKFLSLARRDISSPNGIGTSVLLGGPVGGLLSSPAAFGVDPPARSASLAFRSAINLRCLFALDWNFSLNDSVLYVRAGEKDWKKDLQD